MGAGLSGVRASRQGCPCFSAPPAADGMAASSPAFQLAFLATWTMKPVLYLLYASHLDFMSGWQVYAPHWLALVIT